MKRVTGEMRVEEAERVAGIEVARSRTFWGALRWLVERAQWPVQM